jgi:hypothetical protein
MVRDRAIVSSSYRTLNKRARRKGLEREAKLAKVEVTNKQPSEK